MLIVSFRRDKKGDEEMKIQKTSLRLVREEKASYDVPNIHGPKDAAEAFERVFHLTEEAQEVLVAFFLSTKNEIVGASEISRGSLTESMVPSSQIFKAALLHNAASIMVAHNHPSGDPTPSTADIMATQHLEDAGKVMEIKVLDHIIVGDGTALSILEWNREIYKTSESERELANRIKFPIPSIKKTKRMRKMKEEDNSQISLF